MADQKVSDLPSLNGADVDAADLLYIIDSSAGTAGSKKITVGQYQVAPYSAGAANGVMYLNGSNVVTTGAGLTFDGTNFAATGTASATKLIPTGGTAMGNGMYLPAANTLAWSNNGSETMRLDASGNLGLGVTPSAWNSGGNLQLATGKNISAGTGIGLYGNGYFDGAWKYINTAEASGYGQSGGQHQWFTAPSGTAGNAITFTQAMTLDASGRLILGGTTQYGLFTATTAADKEGVNIFYSPAPSSTAGGALNFWNSWNAGQAKMGMVASICTDGSASYGSALTFSTAGSGTLAERARIDSSGNFLVGATTASAVGNTIFGTATPGVIHQNNNAASNGFVFTSYRRSSVEIGSVSQNGTTAVLFNTTSDRRLKDNIVPAPSASDDIDAIQIVSHDWKAAPDEHVKYGVIAQDLHAVAPQAVLQGDDGDEIERTWGVDYSKLVPMLIKEIQSLRARVAALEAQ